MHLQAAVRRVSSAWRPLQNRRCPIAGSSRMGREQTHESELSVGCMSLGIVCVSAENMLGVNSSWDLQQECTMDHGRAWAHSYPRPLTC